MTDHIVPDPDTTGADPDTFNSTLVFLITSPAGSAGLILTFKISSVIALPPNTLTGINVDKIPCVKFNEGINVVATMLGGVGGVAKPGNFEPVTPR